MSTYGYVVEKLGSAVHIMATEEGTLRKRLQKASVDILIAPTHDLPKPMADELTKLQEDLGGLKLETDVATTQRISSYVDRLVSFANQVRKLPHKYDAGGANEFIPLG